MLLLLLACAPKSPAPTLMEAVDQFGVVAFMTGTWLASDENGSTVESWGRSGPMGMEGTAMTCTPTGDCTTETMRVVPVERGLAFVAVPEGQAEVWFVMTESSGTRVVFENPEHDYPRRIVYEAMDGGLIASIDDGDGGHALRWRFSRAPVP